MRSIHTAVVHCTATPEGRDYSVQTIRGWHKQRGWADIGYHFIVHLDGRVSLGRPITKIGAHVQGHNTGSVGIVYVGGVDATGKPKDTRTPAQKAALRRLLKDLVAECDITRICGHRDLSPDMNGDGKISPNEWTKACPCFDAIPEYADILSGRTR